VIDGRGLKSGGSRTYAYDPAGNTIQIVDPTQQLDLIPDAANRLALSYITTDHLGTTLAATPDTGTLACQGGFEPLGADWNRAGAAGVFLRFPTPRRTGPALKRLATEIIPAFLPPRSLSRVLRSAGRSSRSASRVSRLFSQFVTPSYRHFAPHAAKSGADSGLKWTKVE